MKTTKSPSKMTASEIVAAYEAAEKARMDADRAKRECRDRNPCGPNCGSEKYKAWDSEYSRLKAESRRANLRAAYWREIAKDRLRADAAAAYAEAVRPFVGKQAGERTREKLYNAVSERLADIGYSWRHYAANESQPPRVYAKSRDRLCFMAAVEIGMYAKEANGDGWDHFVSPSNAITDAVPKLDRIDLARFADADTFADAFETATAEIRKARDEFRAKTDALRDAVSFGDIAPAYWSAYDEILERGVN